MVIVGIALVCLFVFYVLGVTLCLLDLFRRTDKQYKLPNNLLDFIKRKNEEAHKK